MLREALALWRGHALADVADLAFAQAHAARLEEDRLAAIESLKTAELACGQHAAVVGELEQLTEMYPTREQLWILRMLALYRCGRQADALAAYRAVRTVLTDELSVDPSQDLRRFHLTAGNAPQVANICRRLDGVPLAIELAAARLNALSIVTLASRLDDRFLLLTTGSRAALPRHRALVAAIDWSHDLLTEAEQVCLRRLTVFAGGCTLDAAEVVCCDDQLPAGLLLDIIGSLVDKSLLIAQERAGVMRYGMLESINVYASRRLDEAGERAAVVARHRAWLADLAGRADSDGPSQAAWLDLVQADLDNFMAGLERAVDPDADGHDAAAALALAGRLATFWMVRGPAGPGRRWLHRSAEAGHELGRRRAHGAIAERARPDRRRPG